MTLEPAKVVKLIEGNASRLELPMSRLLAGVTLLHANEDPQERTRELLDSMVLSRKYIKTMQRTLESMPELSEEIDVIIVNEQNQLQATFDELIALKKLIEERAHHEFEI